RDGVGSKAPRSSTARATNRKSTVGGRDAARRDLRSAVLAPARGPAGSGARQSARPRELADDSGRQRQQPSDRRADGVDRQVCRPDERSGGSARGDQGGEKAVLNANPRSNLPSTRPHTSSPDR